MSRLFPFCVRVGLLGILSITPGLFKHRFFSVGAKPRSIRFVFVPLWHDALRFVFARLGFCPFRFPAADPWSCSLRFIPFDIWFELIRGALVNLRLHKSGPTNADS